MSRRPLAPQPSLIDYTVQWAGRLISRGSSRRGQGGHNHRREPVTTVSMLSPSIGSPQPLIIQNYAVECRHRWYFCVGIGFLVTLLFNVASWIIITQLPNISDHDTEAETAVTRFLQQPGSQEFLQNMQLWRRRDVYNRASKPNDFHSLPLTYRKSVHRKLIKFIDATQGGYEEKIIGWGETDDTTAEKPGLLYNNVTGRFKVTRQGLYQVYSNIHFQGPSNREENDPVEFRQSIHFSDGQLLQDVETKQCIKYTTADNGCHTSVIYAIASLEKGVDVWVSVQPFGRISIENSVDGSSFFGLVMLS